MYINNDVVLRDDLPESLKRDFEELQSYYDAEDWLMFDITFEGIEATVKANYHAGKISINDLNAIFTKYGI